MNDKLGRNDPCSCGSGKKYKHCCMLKKTGKRKLTAKWINAPKTPNLMERTYGSTIASSEKVFTPLKEESNPDES